MFPSSFLGSSLAHLEPELGPFEVDDIGDDDEDDLSHHHYLPKFLLCKNWPICEPQKKSQKA